MPKCRVFEAVDGTLRVNYPNPKHKRPDETDDEFVARIAAIAVARDPTLADAVGTVDVEQAALPARFETDGDGDERPCRSAWRKIGNAVQIDDAQIPENWTGMAHRLRVMAQEGEFSGQETHYRRLRAASLDRDGVRLKGSIDSMPNGALKSRVTQVAGRKRIKGI